MNWRLYPPKVLVVTLDGRTLPVSTAGVLTPAFAFQIQATDNVIGTTDGTYGRAAVDGTPIMLRPLSRGQHTLTIEEQIPGLPRFVTVYKITVP